eukprot:TRINITY_DN1431_c0_g2_i1.p1 TRINITY_DN1431_c0_g2~~TRINITY_DN1431_c0_g2_i1.p1  ORF type:complete len:350 (+),score=77.56 TRINITY_DN1431_c0_g2_i1:165-1214(+)
MEKNVSFTQFENKISSQMQLPLGTFVLKYKDDEGDVIPIASDIELEEAVRQAATRSPPVIEVIVETRKIIGSEEKERDAKKQKNENPTPSGSEEQLVIHPVVCSVCQFPIVGTRYKCIICPHFDLCELCEVADNAHPADHPLIKAKRPLPADVSSVIALSTGLRSVTSSVESGAKQVVGGVQNSFQHLSTNLHHYQQHLKQSVIEHQPQIDAARQQALEKWRQFNQEMKLQAQAISENLKAKASELGEKLKREKEQWFAGSNTNETDSNAAPAPQETDTGASSSSSSSSPQVSDVVASEPSTHTSQPLFADQLATLSSMGFTDTDKNISLLSRHQGDVSLTIQTLLDGV